MTSSPPAGSCRETCERCRKAAGRLAGASFAERKQALQLIADELQQCKRELIDANEADCVAAAGRLDGPAIKRLRVTEAAIDETLKGVRDLAALERDPIGSCQLAKELSPGLNLYRVTCPIGVLCVIYEARPLVGVQLSCLALLSGNGVVLKGGSEAKQSNSVVRSIVCRALAKSSISPDCVGLIETRDDVAQLLKLDDLIDLVVPRGSKELVKNIKANTTIPVLGHADGICHVYADCSISDIPKAVSVIVDGKTNYPAACNALETLLVHRDAAAKLLPAVAEALAPFKVEFHADAESQKYLPGCKSADEQTYATEWLGPAMSVRVVDNVKQAVEHINKFGSKHTDVFLGECVESADYFCLNVDAAGTYVNCSSRFADGYRYGFGAEVGISTNKIHSRGPVGTEGLLIYKYKLIGNYHTVGGMGTTWNYTHKDLPVPPRIDSVAQTSSLLH